MNFNCQHKEAEKLCVKNYKLFRFLLNKIATETEATLSKKYRPTTVLLYHLKGMIKLYFLMNFMKIKLYDEQYQNTFDIGFCFVCLLSLKKVPVKSCYSITII